MSQNGASNLSNLGEKTRAKWAANPEEIARTLPPMFDLTIENIREFKASHDYVRDVGSQFDEWEQSWQFLTRVCQIPTDGRHEFVLLPDILGISVLVDAILYPSVPGATESSVLGPFHEEEAHLFRYGDSITIAGSPGEPTIVQGFVKDTD